MVAVFSVFLVYSINTAAMSGQEQPAEEGKKTGESMVMVKTDDESIALGKKLFDGKCGFCHKINSTEKTIGPGLKGIMKGDKVLVSKKPATPENIVDQLKDPYQKMPPFTSLSDEDVLNIIAYLNTL
jgi:cytochrome c2